LSENLDNQWNRCLNRAVIGLLNTGEQAVIYFTRRDLLGESVGPLEKVWNLPEPLRIIRKQQPDGSWKGPVRKTVVFPENHSDLVATFKSFRMLIERYEYSRDSEVAESAAEFLFSFQTAEGDIRGFIANQYATYYTGAVLSLLIQAGYAEDPRIEKGIQWLLSMRQSDGGWTIPILTHKLDRATQNRLTSRYAEPLQPDRSKPFSHHWTGMVLRAFAALPAYQKSEAVTAASGLLKSRFFLPDAYSSYRAADYWIRFEHPFWWNNLVTALDSLSLLGVPGDDPDIRRGLDWLREHQEEDGLWRRSYAKSRGEEKVSTKAQEMKLWITLAICRVFIRFTRNGQSVSISDGKAC